MKKFISLVYLIMGLTCYSQQGPSIRLEGDVVKYGVLVGYEDGSRAVMDSGMTLSNGTMSVSNLTITGTVNLPGPMVIQNIVGDTIDATNSLTLKGVGVATTNDIPVITQTVTTNTTEIPSSAAVQIAISNATPTGVMLLSGNTTNIIVGLTNSADKVTMTYTGGILTFKEIYNGVTNTYNTLNN